MYNLKGGEYARHGTWLFLRNPRGLVQLIVRLLPRPIQLHKGMRLKPPCRKQSPTAFLAILMSSMSQHPETNHQQQGPKHIE
eukprot:2502754-Amphidinium_carterae.1